MGKDKILHFGANLVLSMTGFFRVWLAVGLCIGASIGKEYGDSKAPGNRWDWQDIIADMLGMGVGLLITIGAKALIGR